MTSLFGSLPIRRKLLVMSLVSSASAVALAGGGFLIWEVYQFRSEIAAETSTQARLVADSASASLNFGDRRSAREVLSVLQGSARVQAACLYTVPGLDLFAGFERPGATCPGEPAVAMGFGLERYTHVEPVRDGNTVIGSLYISRDLVDMNRRLRIGAGTVLGLLLLAIGAAFLIAARMQRAIATPLLDLADTARAVSISGTYGPRAVTASSDEIGVVVHAFNDMLDKIGERSAALSKANAELEREVAERRRVETERSAALDRERDANRLKDEFLATLSHELRTPLNAVLGWTRVLRTTDVDDATRARALESVERNARAQARLIEDLLEVSRIVTGKLRLRVDHVDLAAILDAAVEVVQPAAAAKRLRLSTRVEARPALTAGDPDRLQQIIWNLLSNAVKFTPPEGEVSVSLERRDGYVLSVTDTGPGIASKFLPYIFEPFRQADGSASREHGGLGLGLAIAKRLVELHGGTIEAHPRREGTGTAFQVFLPSVLDRALAAAATTQEDTRAPAAGGPPRILDGMHILVVDDEDDARILLQTALAGFGADVSVAGSVDEALAAIDRRVPDVLLSDIGMPGEDGFSLIRRVRKRPAARGGNVPAVAITAYASARDRAEAEDAGYQAHVAKPFEPSEVAAIVARLDEARRRTAGHHLRSRAGHA